MTDTSNIPSNS